MNDAFLPRDPEKPNSSEPFMSEDEALKLADTLSILQAACCIVGVPPSQLYCVSEGLSYKWIKEDRLNLPYNQISTVVVAICNAITSKTLEAAHIIVPSFIDFECLEIELKETDYHLCETLIRVDELKRWLQLRNFEPPFFFGKKKAFELDYLDETHPHFSSQVAAAIKAWEAVQDPELRKGKTVKGAAIQWLEANYHALGLVHNGERNNSAIDRIATLINWDTGGGAPKTPG
tara:strand:- start:4889 stop:5587 length:699 start_codon:yes stop_codon:yes gene_type:complete